MDYCMVYSFDDSRKTALLQIKNFFSSTSFPENTADITPPPFQCLFILAKLHRFSIDGIFMLKMFICIASSSSYSISLHNGTTLESTNLIQIQQSYRNPFYKRNFSKELIQWKPARKQTGFWTTIHVDFHIYSSKLNVYPAKTLIFKWQQYAIAISKFFMMCMLLDTYLSASKIYYHHSLNVNPARILVGIFSLLLNSLKWTLVRRQHSISLQSCISRDLSWYSEFLSETLMHNLLPSTYKFFTPKQYV